MISVRPNFGSYATEAEALHAVVSRIVDAVDPGAIGSGNSEKVDRPLNGFGIGRDGVPRAPEDFEEGLELNTSFVTRIVNEGRKVYHTGPS